MKEWPLEISEKAYTVRVEHSWWSGKRRILVNGKVVHQSVLFKDIGSTHNLTIADRQLHIVIEWSFLKLKLTLREGHLGGAISTSIYEL